MKRWRRYFLTGLVVVAPLGVTVAVLWWLFRTLDAILGDPLEQLLQRHVPGLGLLLLLVAVLLVGWVAHYAIGRQLIGWWSGVLARFPLTGRLYGTLAQVAQAIAGGERQLFLRTVLVELPGGESYRLGWVTAETNPAAEAALGEPCVNVFVPGTPNAASGIVLIVPRRATRALDLTIEEGLQLVVSAGAVVPGRALAPALHARAVAAPPPGPGQPG